MSTTTRSERPAAGAEMTRDELGGDSGALPITAPPVPSLTGGMAGHGGGHAGRSASRVGSRVHEPSSSDSIKPLPADYVPRRRPGRTDGITPRFEAMLEEAQKAGFEAGYRAAFQALGLDARAVKVVRVVSQREAAKVLQSLALGDRIAVLRPLADLPQNDE